jgi:tRNA threonylcarbamoyladenosine biosynthesis protein TsaE
MVVGHHVVPSMAPDSRVSLTLPELVGWGERFGRAVSAPLVVALSGELGAGKTTLVQAICRGYGVPERVTSPTFTIVHEYIGARSPVYHLDLYRLARPEDLTAIGWDEIVARDALVLVEWPERAGARLPAGHVPIELALVPGDPERRLLLAG